jgi:predicted RNase H-like nuclease (RuvC/YqgF family)
MSEAIVVALITGGLSLAGVVVTCVVTSRNSEKKQEIALAVMNAEVKELTREVREHNHFATRMPVLEREVKELDRRVTNLEQYHKAPTN